MKVTDRSGETSRGFGQRPILSVPERQRRAADAWMRGVIAEHGRSVLGFLYNSVGVRGMRAEDVLQETLVKAWRSRDQIKDQASLRAWLNTTAIRTARDMHRGRVNQEIPFDGVVPDAPSGERVDEGVANRLWLKENLDSLSPRQRAAVLMVHRDDLTYEEAARRLGVPEGTVKTQVSRGLAVLRRRMGVEHP